MTYTLDVNTYIAWGRRLQEVGFSQFYQQWSDYLPGYLYVLWFVAGLEKVISFSPVLLYKLPAILADLAVGYLIYKIVRDKVNQRVALLSSYLFLFNPAIFANSTLWGQVDIITALFSLLAIYLFPKHKWLSAISLAIGVAVKPQAALAAPIILVLMLQEKEKLKNLVGYTVVSALVFVALFIPFSAGENIIHFVFNRISVTVSQYPYTSVNAFNFWGLSGFWQPDSSASSTFGVIATIATTVVTSLMLLRKKISPYTALAVLLGVHFMFFTRMHERHLLPMLPPLLIGAAQNRKLLLSYLGLSVTYLANLWYAYYWTINDFASPFPEWLIILMIIANLFLIAWIFLNKYININTNWELRESVKKAPAIFSKKTRKYLLAGILIFTVVTRFYGLQSPNHEYFDEVYHAFTAQIITEGDPKAWEWWNPHPEGFAYEWTHPPFAKLAMAGSMLIFGQNSFAWRLPAAIFGVGVVYMVYKIGSKLFKDEDLGIVAAAVMSLDGLVLVMSRIGMNDIYLLFFLLVSYYWFLTNKYIPSSLAWGLALASKWSAVWILPLFALTFIVQRKKLSWQLLSFIVIPPLIYVANYFPMFVTGHDWETWWGMQKQMWWYHTGLDAEHSYTSPAWSWPFLLRPVWLYVNRVGDSVANIYAMGNPLIIWGGLVSASLAVYELIITKNRNLALVLFGWLVFFVPWIVSPRIMFYYHYLPAMPFLALIIAYVLRQEQKVLKVFMTGALIIFIFFYPHWTGIHIPDWLAEAHYWLHSWR